MWGISPAQSIRQLPCCEHNLQVYIGPVSFTSYLIYTMVNAKPQYKHLQITPLHRTFVAEVTGVDWSRPVSKEVNNEIADAVHHYGVLVFKKTGLDDERHIEWAKNFGELDSILQFVKPGAKTRLAPYYDLWDAGNLDVNGNIIPRSSHQYEYNKVSLRHMNGFIYKGNALWHVDNSSKYPRYSYSALLAHEIPEQGGATQVCIQCGRGGNSSLPMLEPHTTTCREKKKIRLKTTSSCILCGTRGNSLRRDTWPPSTKNLSVQEPTIDWCRLIFWVEKYTISGRTNSLLDILYCDARRICSWT